MKKWKMVQEGDSILLGISGGADSVCLARYFLARREALSLKLYAVHINHMLRGEEAKRDEEFVQDFCHKWNLSLNVEYRNIKEESRQKKCSEEEAGRIARYECFEKYAKEYHCGKIAVAHHQNDAAETILFRMLRGTGPQGMAGILPVNGKIIRPFLCLSREEIMDILQNIGQNLSMTARIRMKNTAAIISVTAFCRRWNMSIKRQRHISASLECRCRSF